MTSVEQGWKALQSGNFSQAVESFVDVMQREPNSIPAMSGLTRLYILTSDLERAQSLAERANQQTKSAETEALLGEVLGMRGNRAQAERHLLTAVQMQPSVAVYGVLLGEQQVRQGRWQDGTESILQAFQAPDDGRAIASLQNMISDLINAIISDRIPEVDGMKFINRLDYSMSAKSSNLTALFGAARRAIHARQPLPRAQQPITIPQAATQQRQQQAPQQPAPQQQAPQQRQQQAPQQQAPQPQQQVRQQQSPLVSRTPAQQNPFLVTQLHPTSISSSSSGSDRLAQRNRVSAASALESRPFGNQHKMVSKMSEERRLNEEIQNMVPQSVLPQWPSQVDNPIDQIPPIGIDARNILGGVTGMQAADFRLTGGDIIIEIVLERCLQNLLEAAHANKATTLPFRPASIARLELNLRDGLLDNLDSLHSLYLEDVKVTNDRILALGSFLGDCIVQTYGGVWIYEHPPEASYIHLGKGATLHPFKLADDWINADDIEDVHLDTINRQAQQAVADQAMLSTVVNYIDPTPGFEGEALAIKLAELWIDYRFSMLDVDLVEIAESIDIVEQSPKITLFAIHAKWTPKSACGPDNRAVTANGKVHMAYIRTTGAFLLLGSRKHFAKYVTLRWNSLNADSAAAIGNQLSATHLAAAKVVNDDANAQKINARFGSQAVSAPRLGSQNNAATLIAWFYTRTTAYQYQLTYAPNQLIACQLQVLRTLSR